jgi:hypothetical protein
MKGPPPKVFLFLYLGSASPNARTGGQADLAESPVVVSPGLAQAEWGRRFLRHDALTELDMRLRLDDPALVPELLAFLQSTPDVVAEVVTENEIEVSLLGSFAHDAMRLDLDLRLRAWEAARNARVPLVELVEEH